MAIPISTSTQAPSRRDLPRPRLTRHPLDRILGGVCGGMAAVVGVSAGWSRLIWVALTLSNPLLGSLGYALLWMLIPQGGLTDLPILTEEPRTGRPEPILLVGGLAALIGSVALAAQFGFFRTGETDLLFPILLLLNGLVALIKQLRRGN